MKPKGMMHRLSKFSQSTYPSPVFRPTTPTLPVARRFSVPPTGAIVALLIASVLLWAASLEHINVRLMDDTGLISVLPPAVFLSLLLLCASFSLTITRQTLSVPLVFVHLVLLIVMAYGITSFVYDSPRFAIGWKLAGIINYVREYGSVDGRIDAFFNWPSFFILMAFLTDAAGLDSPQPFMMWAPVIFNLLYLGPLWIIFRSATIDLRLVALSMWFFYVVNWIGQDYLAPQALNIFLLLSVLAILLTWLRGPAPQPGMDADGQRIFPGAKFLGWLQARLGNWAGYEHPTAPSTPKQRALLLGMVLLMLTAMVASHQLTPFAALAAMSVLIFFNRCTVITLPLILGVMIGTWVFYVATPYVHGHIEHITEPMGSVTSNLDANLTDRFRGSPEHIFINYMRIGMTLMVWGLAFLGGLRRLHNGYRDVSLILLAAAPFPLLGMQAYGGELLLRIYLYSVPFMAFFCAALFLPSPLAGRGWRATLVLTGASFVLLIGFLFTRYGNERMMYFTDDEVEAVHTLYAIAEPGAQLVAATGTLPWRFQDYRTYRYTTVPRQARAADIEAVAGMMASDRYPSSYLILTRSQKASGELFIGWPPGTWELFVDKLHASDKFVLIYANQDAEIFALAAQMEE